MNMEESRLFRFTLSDAMVRGAVLDGTQLLRDMKEAHETGVLESYALGQAYLGTALLSANLKGRDRLSVQVDCAGPLKGFAVETNARGDVRGFLKTEGIELEKPLESFDLAEFWGQGIIAITKLLEGSKTPYTGQTILQTSNLAQDFAYYFLTSEQIHTAFSFSIHFSRDGEIDGAAGVFLQAMPRAEDEAVDHITDKIHHLPSLGKLAAEGHSVLKEVEKHFSTDDFHYLESDPIQFFCPCSHERFASFVGGLPQAEKENILKEGPFPLQVRCHYCNTNYSFEKAELDKLFTS
jgi:molecular chaperone Hsp33